MHAASDPELVRHGERLVGGVIVHEQDVVHHAPVESAVGYLEGLGGVVRRHDDDDFLPVQHGSYDTPSQTLHAILSCGIRWDVKRPEPPYKASNLFAAAPSNNFPRAAAFAIRGLSEIHARAPAAVSWPRGGAPAEGRNPMSGAHPLTGRRLMHAGSARARCAKPLSGESGEP